MRIVALATGWMTAVALAVALFGLAPASAQTKPGSHLPSPALQQQQEAAAALWRQRNYPEALAAYQRIVAATRAEFGPDHEQVAIQSYSLALVAEQAGRLDVAERALRDNIAVGEKVYGRDTVFLTQGQEKLADVLIAAGRAGEAETILNKALSIRTATLGGDHSFNASVHAGLGAARLARGDAAGALESYRRAVHLLTGKRETQTLAAHVMENEIRRQLAAFSGLVDAAWQSAGRGGSVNALTDETFAASQRSWTTSAASALARMSARLSAGETDLGRRIRRQQDAVERVLALHQEDMRELERWSKVQRADPVYSELLERFRAVSIERSRDNQPAVKRQTELVAQLQEHLARCPPGQKKKGCEHGDKERNAITKELGELSRQTSRGAGDLMAVHREMEAAEARLPGYAAFKSAREKRIDEQVRLDRAAAAERNAIVKSFPDYVALTEPQPLTIADTQKLLQSNEAMVTLLVGKRQSFVWAISRERAVWARIPAGSEALAGHVTVLRNGLDPLASGGAARFDLARAHELYRLLLGPVEAVIRDKPSLILVPTGPLTSLPFQVLLTAPAPSAAAGPDTVRAADWLIKRHALVTLPSVPSLAALRRVGAPLRAAEPFLGIGDPILNGRALPADQARGRQLPALAAIYRNGVPDLRALRELSPLPETAVELKAIAAALHAPDEALLLEHEATETRVKREALDRFRVIHFATHGLVAGELSGLSEPALVLTPPIRPSATDDGLLTASEVAALRLRADWVVLSACNTAAGSEVGAEALSGLARAFFFAGARALLVSHWAVNSDATVALTTSTFSTLAKNPKLGRAEAFRQTMLKLIDAGLAPGLWGPFVIVGEGAPGA